MTESRYAVHLRESWTSSNIALLIFDKLTDAFLAKDGTWKPVKEGVAMPEDDLFMLPRGSIETLAQAIDNHLGHASHADTEARVLREWLTVEQKRVDQILGTPGHG